MEYVGGLRARLIHDSIFRMVSSAITELGWLDANRDHSPIALRYQQIGNDEDVVPNIICVTAEDVTEDPIELGSDLCDNYWNYYIDIYAENDVLGLHLATDLKDILKGRFTQSVSVGGPSVHVYDYSTPSATPIPLFYVQLEEVQINKSRFYQRPFQQFWWVVSFRVVDTYDTESG